MIPRNAKSPAVFLDRDGTIMHDADYCSDPKQVKFSPACRKRCGG